MKFIAELCQNHNGNVDTLCKMVDAAAEGGATHIKIQHIYARNLVYRAQFENGLICDEKTISIKRPWQVEYERLKNLEISDTDCRRFVKYVESVGLIPMTTCFARCDLNRIIDQGFKNIKIASYDCASFTMIREVARHFQHTYISTGASYDDEIIIATDILKDIGTEYSVLHCITQYPTPLDSMNLNRIKWLSQFTSEVGFSDHSNVSKNGMLAAKAAVLCGAKVVERHFTILDEAETKDGPVSIRKEDIKELQQYSTLSEDDQLTNLNECFSNWRTMLGLAQRDLSHAELLNRDYYRGRFATPRHPNSLNASEMIFNWEETPIKR